MIYRKRDLRAHLFFNKRPLLQGRAISRQSQVCRVSQLSSLLRNRRRSHNGDRFDSTIWNPGIIFASLGTLSPVMGTYIDAPAHTSTRHSVKRGRELRRGQPDAMKYAGLRNHRVHPILKNSPKVNPNRAIFSRIHETAY